MVSVQHIEKGEEVFNTYGQMANWQLLHMYGFAEPFPTNSNDTADIQMSSVYKAAVQGATLLTSIKSQLLDTRNTSKNLLK